MLHFSQKICMVYFSQKICMVQFLAENLNGTFFAENLYGLFFAENLHGSFFAENLYGSFFEENLNGSLFAENPMLVILIAWEWRRAASSSELQRKDLYVAHSRSNWEYLRNILSRNLTYIQTMYFVFRLFTAIYACEGRLYSQLTL